MGHTRRWVYCFTVAWGASLMWLAPRLPMVELPRHAAQVGLVRDLVSGASPWGHIVRVEVQPTSLLEYGPLLILSFLIPVQAAYSLLLTLAYVGSVVGCVWLRAEMNGDARLDWLFVPGFFGVAWKLGLVGALVSLPAGVLFFGLARRHAEQPSPCRGAQLAAVGLVLFFANGLVFPYVLLVGLAVLLAHRPRRDPRSAARLAPYAGLASLALGYGLISSRSAMPPGSAMAPAWEGGAAAIPGRVAGLFLHPFGLDRDHAFALVALIAFLAPVLSGCRLNRSRPGWWAPFSITAILSLAAPSSALGTLHLDGRLALFLLPCYALLFTRPSPEISASRARRAGAIAAAAALPLACWAFFAVQTVRLRAFARESADAHHLLGLVPKGKRLLSLVPDPSSRAAHNPAAYLHHAAWYQARRRGLVEPSVSSGAPQIVHLRDDGAPPALPDLESAPLAFDFHLHRGRSYDYFLVRDNHPETPALVDRLLDNGECHVERAASSGEWVLLARGDCLPAPGQTSPRAARRE